MTKCCDQHDICYDTCNNDKEVCDMEFKRCLYRYCDNYERNIGGVTVVKGKISTGHFSFDGLAYNLLQPAKEQLNYYLLAR